MEKGMPTADFWRVKSDCSARMRSGDAIQAPAEFGIQSRQVVGKVATCILYER